MNALWMKLVTQASSAGAFLEAVSEHGIRFLRSSLGALPLFTSTAAHGGDTTVEADESHYFLVPYRGSACGYALYTVRALPPGVGPSNPLPKARLFHVHHPVALRVLEDLLIAERQKRRLAGALGRSDLAEGLEHLADEIDQESNKATCGLLIVGGVVALVNPIIGAGIAAKSLFPALGAKASKLGLHYAGRKIRQGTDALRRRRALRAAKAEVRKLKPEQRINPLLVLLEEALSTSDPTHDPLLSPTASVNDFTTARHLRVTIQAILSVYDDVLAKRSSPESLGLHPPDRRWLEHLRTLLATLGRT